MVGERIYCIHTHCIYLIGYHHGMSPQLKLTSVAVPPSRREDNGVFSEGCSSRRALWMSLFSVSALPTFLLFSVSILLHFCSSLFLLFSISTLLYFYSSLFLLFFVSALLRFCSSPFPPGSGSSMGSLYYVWKFGSLIGQKCIHVLSRDGCTGVR